MNSISANEQLAIDAAINNDWYTAIKLNQQIIDVDNNNINAYLRLGFALLRTKQIDEAERAYKKAIEIQPKNRFAIDNLERISIIKQSNHSTDQHNGSIEKQNLNPSLFLDVPGKTKAVPLVNLGQKQVLAQLSIGQEVFFRLKKKHIEIRTKNNDYIGALPNDISKRIEYFLQNDSQYGIYIKEALLTSVTVFIKEIRKGQEVDSLLSFPESAQMLNILSKTHSTESAADTEDEDIETDIEEDQTDDVKDEEDEDIKLYVNQEEDDDED